MSLLDKVSLALIPSAYKVSKVYSVLPSNGDGDFTFTRNSSATRVNSNGLIETAGVNVPRLDYSDGNCPSLLLEPQRTNLFTYSEDFTQSYWISSEVSETLDNSEINPYGSNGSYIIESISSFGRLTVVESVTPNTDYTVSFYAKNIDATNLRIYMSNSSVPSYFYTSEVNTDTWTRVVVNFTTGTGTSCIIQLTRDFPIGQKVYLWGAQLEQGSYATSYIPTNGSISTRILETCNDAGNASTFNDSEGVLFIEATALENGGVNRYITISNGTSNERLVINYDGNSNRLTISAATAIGSVTPIFFTNFTQNQLNKIAIRYSSTDLTFFINGVKEETNTSNASFSPNSLNKLNLSNWNDIVPFFGKVKQLQYFDTALTDTELQELTTL